MKSDEIDLIEGAEAAAGVLGLSKRQVYHMVAKKRLPYTRIGNRLYFRRSELDIAFRSRHQNFEMLTPSPVFKILDSLIEKGRRNVGLCN
ncbi:MAG: helix-turn-helix domain-containing protein [Parasphingorhabdus sp.]